MREAGWNRRELLPNILMFQKLVPRLEYDML